MPVEVIDRYIAAKQERGIIYLRTTLMRLYFEYEAYSNPNRDLNKLYWNLFEKYLKLPRHDEIKPWAAIIHYTTHPVYLHNYLIADIIAAQTINFLKRNYGTVVDNPMVGSFLVQNYFRFGSRYDWRELLERGTGERLNPKYLINRLGI
jgi:peptidyl-dipeptidase A